MRGSQRRRPLGRPPPSRGFPWRVTRRASGADKLRQRHGARVMGQGRAAPIPWTYPRGRKQLDDFTTERTGVQPIRSRQTEVGIPQGEGRRPSPCDVRKGAQPRLVRARRYSAGKPRIAGRASEASGGEQSAHGLRAPPAVSGPRTGRARQSAARRPQEPVQTYLPPPAKAMTNTARLAWLLQTPAFRPF